MADTLFKVTLRPNHPTGTYRRGGFVFVRGADAYLTDTDLTDDIKNDPYLDVSEQEGNPPAGARLGDAARTASGPGPGFGPSVTGLVADSRPGSTAAAGAPPASAPQTPVPAQTQTAGQGVAVTPPDTGPKADSAVVRRGRQQTGDATVPVGGNAQEPGQTRSEAANSPPAGDSPNAPPKE